MGRHGRAVLIATAAAVCFVIVLAPACVVADDMSVVHANILNAMLPDGSRVAAFQKEVSDLITMLQPNGTWPDVNYDDPDGRSWWETGVHLQRCLLVTTMWASPLSGHFNDSAAAKTSDTCLEWWLDNKPRNTNWWWEQIGVPRIVGKILLLRPSSHHLSMAEPIFDRTPLHVAQSWTGCNRVWGSTVNVMRGLLEGNESLVSAAFTVAHSAVGVKSYTTDGVQEDQSFHQHGPQLYTGWGYGVIYSTNLLMLESYAAGTSFVMEDDQWDIFAGLVLDGQQLGTRGPNSDYTSSGRLMTYFVNTNKWGTNLGHYHYFAAFTPFELAFPSFAEPFATPLAVAFASLLPSVPSTRARADEMHAYYARMSGDPAAPALSIAKHFHDSDYLVQHRPHFMASVRMFSNRTINTECVNSENKQGRDLADGVLNVYLTGREYEGVYPVWKWTLLPGTTELRIPNKVYTCEDVRSVSHTSWVGGLATGHDGVGVAAFNFSRGHASHLGVHKAWFFGDDVVVALGTNISSAPLPGTGGVPYAVATTLDQRPTSSSVLVQRRGQPAPVTVAKGDAVAFDDAQWVWHGGIAYAAIVAGEMRVNVSNVIQSGSLANITQGPDTPIEMQVFSALLDHGTPIDEPGSYAYVVVPDVNSSDIQSRVDEAAATAVVVAHSTYLQAVCMPSTDAGAASLLAVFWPPNDETLTAATPDGLSDYSGDCLAASVDVASFVAVSHYKNNTVSVSVSNPAVEARPLSVTVTIAALLGGDGCIAVNATHSKVEFALPEGNNAGGTVTKNCVQQ